MSNAKIHLQELKSAKRTFKYWFKVLLNSDLMDDVEHRKEYQEALDKIKSSIKNLKSGT